MNLSEEVLGALSYEVSIRDGVSLHKASEVVHDLLSGVSFQHESIASLREVLGVTNEPGKANVEPARVPGSIFQPRTRAPAGPFIQASALGLEYGGRGIFKNAAFSLSSTERCAVIGPNGAGKSSLIRLILGDEEPTSGSLMKNPAVHYAHLPQAVTLTEEERSRLVITEIQRSPKGIFSIREELKGIDDASASATGPKLSKLIQQQQELLEKFAWLGGHQLDGQYFSILRFFGFSIDDFYRPLGTLSGGELTRLYLAKIILEKPHVIILDEPTNNLDIEGISWLQTFLTAWKGGIICVSHERSFIDEVFPTIVEVANGNVRVYAGNYSAYEQQKAAEFEAASKKVEKEQKQIAHSLDIYRRLQRGGSFGRSMAYKTRAERQMRDATSPPPRPNKGATVVLSNSVFRGNLAIQANNLRVGYPGNLLFTIPGDLTISPGDRIGIVGRNGIGKSTLLRTLIGETPPISGQVKRGQGITISTLAQFQSELNEKMDPVALLAGSDRSRRGVAKQILAQLAISSESSLLPVGLLSGGEKVKVALAMAILRKPDLLLLDEPTNHLDIPSRLGLERALKSWKGALVCVSHDPYFLERTCNKLWLVSPEGISQGYF
jgi:ATP-binding cassette subfamily F protein 3